MIMIRSDSVYTCTLHLHLHNKYSFQNNHSAHFHLVNITNKVCLSSLFLPLEVFPFMPKIYCVKNFKYLFQNDALFSWPGQIPILSQVSKNVDWITFCKILIESGNSFLDKEEEVILIKYLEKIHNIAFVD